MPGREEIDAFRREAEALGRLQHPNFVNVHEVGTHQGKPFIVMEWVEGGNLAQALPRMSLRERIKHLEQIARAMNIPHQQGIVHLDLKPLNILLKKDVHSQDCRLRPGPSALDSESR